MAERLVEGSVHCKAIVYVRPFPFAVRLSRNCAVMGPVICQSPALAPSSAEICTMLHDALQVFGVSTVSVSDTILPFGGHNDGCDGATLMLSSANEWGAKLAGGLGTPCVTPS